MLWTVKYQAAAVLNAACTLPFFVKLRCKFTTAAEHNPEFKANFIPPP